MLELSLDFAHLSIVSPYVMKVDGSLCFFCCSMFSMCLHASMCSYIIHLSKEIRMFPMRYSYELRGRLLVLYSGEGCLDFLAYDGKGEHVTLSKAARSAAKGHYVGREATSSETIWRFTEGRSEPARERNSRLLPFSAESAI